MYENNFYTLEYGKEWAILYTVKTTGEAIPFSWPQFEIEGKVSGSPKYVQQIQQIDLTDGITKIIAEGVLDCGAKLTLELQVSPYSPIIRFRYLLAASKKLKLTKTETENLIYLTYPVKDGCQQTEVRLSGYDYLVHGYQLEEIAAFETEDQLMGPILAEQRGSTAMLTAYEHGSQYPDKFVIFEHLGSSIVLKAKKGNYWNGQPIGEKAFETIWLQAGAVEGTIDDLARVYREFQLKYCSLNAESRKPYIFYNTWAFQERNKFYNKATYLASMNQERIEQEIDIAHKMGIDVFVIDTGWYQKTGDWEVNLKKFPDGLKSIRQKLESYGMKLGLWFNPTVAAKTSQLLQRYPESLSKQNGIEPVPFPIWETEESYPMCLVSEYWEAFADYLIYLVDSIGVTYFKWDGIAQYGCNRKDHFHGGDGCTEEEAWDCYAFQIGLYMSKVIDRICKVHPEVIVDFDVTEGGRYFGLGFLSSGKYFFMNNGPYYSNYDITVPEDVWTNIFVQPGPARSWICRKGLCYDKWIPSVLMMTHYLPDDPESSQLINIASLILGQNGIWGDLLSVSKEGVERFSEILNAYKRVRDEITEASPYVLGQPGATFEVHEKINHSGKGVVVLFANKKGIYEYRLQNKTVDKAHALIFGNAELSGEKGNLKITVRFEASSAAIVFFE